MWNGLSMKNTNKKSLLEKLYAAMESTEIVSPVEEIETSLEASDIEEDDTNADMAMSDLRSIARNAQELHDMLTEDDTIPAWMASKITLAADYINAAAEYMKSEKSEIEEPEEISDEINLDAITED